MRISDWSSDVYSADLVRSEEEIGHRADERDQAQQEIQADIAHHSRHLKFRHADIARFPRHPRAERRADGAAADGNANEDHIETHWTVDPRNSEQPFDQLTHALDELATRGRG